MQAYRLMLLAAGGFQFVKDTCTPHIVSVCPSADCTEQVSSVHRDFAAAQSFHPRMLQRQRHESALLCRLPQHCCTSRWQTHKPSPPCGPWPRTMHPAWWPAWLWTLPTCTGAQPTQPGRRPSAGPTASRSVTRSTRRRSSRRTRSASRVRPLPQFAEGYGLA